jgi:SAM-dependent methyltransferase
VNGYRQRVFSEMRSFLEALGPLDHVLDVGAGDGWFAMSVEKAHICAKVEAIDVLKRRDSYHRVELYSGDPLPFPDAAYDLVYAVDTIHHAESPTKLLSEMARCTRRYLLLKDHIWRSKFGWLMLTARDEVGNRRFGVPCVYRFQRGWEWDAILQGAGLRRVDLLYPLACHAGTVGRFANKSEFLSLWEKE